MNFRFQVSGLGFMAARSKMWTPVTLKMQSYRGTSLIRNSAPLGPYSRTLHRVLWWPYGRGLGEGLYCPLRL